MSFFRRINAIGTVTDNEYELLKNEIPELTSLNILVPSFIKQSTDNFSFPKNNENRCMIGHSSFSLHNHADIFKIISAFNQKNKLELVVPLSHGSMDYREKILHLGKKLFVNRFIPVTEYLSVEQYFNLLNSCGVFILYSHVQQAGATIYHFMRNGGKVYLDENNPLYIDSKRRGYVLFSIQSELNEEHLLNHQLSQKEKESNRNLFFAIRKGDQMSEENAKAIRNYLVN